MEVRIGVVRLVIFTQHRIKPYQMLVKWLQLIWCPLCL